MVRAQENCWSLEHASPSSENAFPKVPRVVSSNDCQNHSLNNFSFPEEIQQKELPLNPEVRKDLQWAVYHLSTAFKMLKLGSNKTGRVKSTTWDAV